MDQIAKAAKLAGDWWAERLDQKYSHLKNEFSNFIATKCEAELRASGFCFLEVDYDPHGILLDAVREVIQVKCDGLMFSADGILPRKHELSVSPSILEPKEGYGSWTENILVYED